MTFNIYFKKLVFISVFILLVTPFAGAQDDKPNTKYWIIFKDKGEYTPDMEIAPGSPAYNSGLALLNQRAIDRRRKVLPEDRLIDYADLPLDQQYVDQIKAMGIDIIAQSRWLNGVSAYLTKSQMEKVRGLDFVSHLRVVNKLISQEMFSIADESYYESLEYFAYRAYMDTSKSSHRLDYGKSLRQNEVVNVPPLHDMGVTGKGVLIASFDDGFGWKWHEALRGLLITQEYDFINKDRNTAPEENQKYKDSYDQGGHGTATLSSMAGYMPGKLIGPSFDSEIILAKTEYVSEEVPMEEDFWLEAAEWAEALGVDIITSSLIYKDYDDPYGANTYEYENYDGNTAITTIAGDRASYLGVVVVNAMGNYYQTATPSLGSAADGDTIISVGAITLDGDIAYFSSNGPTSDGRIKPEVVAPGVNVYVADMNKNYSDKYNHSNGTSFSTPITAGVIGLMLSAHPELTPMQVREALMNTASNTSSPNNLIGWGIVNAYDAALYFGMVWSNEAEFNTTASGQVEVSTYLASKTLIDPKTVRIFYSTGGNDFEEASLVLTEPKNDGNNSGKYSVVLEDVAPGSEIKYYFYAKDFNGDESFYPKGAPDKYMLSK